MKPSKYALIEILLAAVVTAIILHQIEAGYEQEWALFDLSVGMSGFLLMNTVIVALPFLGFHWLVKENIKGLIVSLAAAIGGLVPFLVHIVFMPKDGHFEEPISILIMVAGAVFGVILFALTTTALFWLIIPRRRNRRGR